MHIHRDLYLHAREGHLPPEKLLHLAHRHLLEVCPTCRLEFVADQQSRAEAPERSASRDVPLPAVPTPFPHRSPLPDDARKIGKDHLVGRLDTLATIRTLRDLTRRHLLHLMQESPENWRTQIKGARSRYRLRAFAERLLEDSRLRVRNQPELAGQLASLVPLVLRWLPGAAEEPWRLEMEVRAAAWKANSLRVVGDLPASEALFAEVQQGLLVRGSAVGEWVRGEIASLRASLRIEQRKYVEARQDLSFAQAIFQRMGDLESVARSLVQEANLQSILGQPAEALVRFEEASAHLDSLPDGSDLQCCVVSGRIAALCSLDRYDDAQRLLNDHWRLLQPKDDPYLCAVSQHHQGRIALGKGDLEKASCALREGQEIFLRLQRDHDALLLSLDLAQVHLEAGRLDELHDLAADLVVQFQARGVARETLAALGLLARAAAAREVSRDLLDHVRGLLKPERSPVRRGKPL